MNELCTITFLAVDFRGVTTLIGIVKGTMFCDYEITTSNQGRAGGRGVESHKILMTSSNRVV